MICYLLYKNLNQTKDVSVIAVIETFKNLFFPI